jgi:hypothetical protein
VCISEKVQKSAKENVVKGVAAKIEAIQSWHSLQENFIPKPSIHKRDAGFEQNMSTYSNAKLSFTASGLKIMGLTCVSPFQGQSQDGKRGT